MRESALPIHEISALSHCKNGKTPGSIGYYSGLETSAQSKPCKHSCGNHCLSHLNIHL